MSNAFTQAAKAVTLLVPTKPKTTLLGGEAYRIEMRVHQVYFSAAVAAWKTAATYALGEAMVASLPDWIIDADQQELIDGCRDIAALEQMCDPEYPWAGRSVEQV